MMPPPRRCGRRCATYCLGGAGREDSSKPRAAKKATKRSSAAHDDGTERPTGAAARRGPEADAAAAAEPPGSGGKAQHTKGAAALNGAAASRYQVMEPPSPPPGSAAPDGLGMKQFLDVYAAGPAAHYYYGAAAPVGQGIVGYGAPPPSGLPPAGGRSAAGIGYGPHMVQPYWVDARRARNSLHAAEAMSLLKKIAPNPVRPSVQPAAGRCLRPGSSRAARRRPRSAVDRAGRRPPAAVGLPRPAVRGQPHAGRTAPLASPPGALSAAAARGEEAALRHSRLQRPVAARAAGA